MSSKQESRIPVTSSFIPFLPSPEFLKDRETSTSVEEYVPEPVQKGNWTKYGYIPTQINKPAETKEPEKINKGSERTQQRRARRLRQTRKSMNNEANLQRPGSKKTYIVPTRSIPKQDPYWFPVFWHAKKPENEHSMFHRSFVTMRDKQRVLIKTFGDGKITVWRAGEEITLRNANSFGIGTR